MSFWDLIHEKYIPYFEFLAIIFFQYAMVRVMVLVRVMVRGRGGAMVMVSIMVIRFRVK